MYENIKTVGLPMWDENDQTLAKALQKEVSSKEEEGLATELKELGLPVKDPISGGSDDIGDISWKLPTVTLRFPSNIPGLQGHHWSNAVAMATPIAHKGATAGARVVAMTLIDFLTQPQMIDQAWTYFKEVQGKETEYKSMISDEEKPAIYLNTEVMSEYKPKLEQFYYDESKYDTYLEQLGIKYPTIKTEE